ncbi:MAG: nucleotide 5'-monophosphate nucleosidase PpnN [Gammaproteobacteria bacterium]|nr:nucleotide 5'-monophosphate nucleosidase PpnN [Gammaproteobacteria bacterium]
MANKETLVEVMPEGSLELLSQHEVDRLRNVSTGGQHEILRRCALAVLNVGSRTDDAREVLETHASFDVRIIQQERGIKLALTDPPSDAFVDGTMIRGIRELLFAVVRDVAFVSNELELAGRLDFGSSDGITNGVFHILRNAGIFQLSNDPDLIVCWGGHAIGREEYDYSKEVGYQLGLRSLNVCTGCGSGAMKGPMKGAALAHAKQRIGDGRYVGLTEPDIIAAESPNPIVNQLVILPDMEKRLEAFIRVAHGIVVFPGGVGTAEEILFLLGVLSHPDNRNRSVPVIMTGPESAAEYFAQIDDFIRVTLGPEARNFYRIEIGSPKQVAQVLAQGVADVKARRRQGNDAFYFNWRLRIADDFQQPFVATHENMAALNLTQDQSMHELAANLRRAFSGMVTGNVKEQGIRAIEEHGPFEVRGDKNIMSRLDALLASFVEQKRMRLPGAVYKPCYRLVS